MKIAEMADMLRREARRLDDTAGVYTQEAIVMREAANKLDELQMRKAATASAGMKRGRRS